MVWNMEGPPKMRQFLWKACSGSLATLKRLYSRHIRDNNRCSLCNAALETIYHAIIGCPNVEQIWCCSSFSEISRDAPLSSFVELLLWIKSKMVEDYNKYNVATGGVSVRREVGSRSSWQRPRVEWTTVNTDVVVLSETVIGPGVVMRTDERKIITAGVSRVNGKFSVKEGKQWQQGSVSIWQRH
uniref:Reverse transcriptase zinc-binding domain-containing protein n=1 Tax=Chenopodium quinoa TaxID=63459 RepID=A0A803KUG5_CHEQI